MDTANVQPDHHVTVANHRQSHDTFDLDFAASRDRLVALCRSFVGDDAEDVVHDVYLAARAAIRRLRDRDRLDAWLTKIAVNECFRRHRRRQALARLLPLLKPKEDHSSDPDLRRLIEELPNRERTIVVLHYGHGLELEEISDLLSLKASTVRSILFRTRRRLRAALEPGLGESL